MSRRSPLLAIETVTEDLPARRHPGRTTVGFVVAGALHVALFLVLFHSSPEVQALREAMPLAVHLHRTAPKPRRSPPREPTATKPAAAAPAPAHAASRVVTRTPVPPPPHLAQHPAPIPSPLPTVQAAVVPTADLTPGELAGALTAGEGDGGGGTGGTGAGGSGGGGAGRGGGCSMLARLQSALRRNAKVQAAAAARSAEVGGRPVVVWRDGWVQSAGEAGRGLAGVRQAITLEIAFAPEACREETVHGFVLVPLSASPGAPRLALGAPSWRWSDLLEVRRPR